MREKKGSNWLSVSRSYALINYLIIAFRLLLRSQKGVEY